MVFIHNLGTLISGCSAAHVDAEQDTKTGKAFHIAREQGFRAEPTGNCSDCVLVSERNVRNGIVQVVPERVNFSRQRPENLDFLRDVFKMSVSFLLFPFPAKPRVTPVRVSAA